MNTLARFSVITLLLLVSSGTTAYASQAASKIPQGWLEGSANVDRAVKLHRELNVPLAVYFYVDWCPYCHALENEYFPTAPLQAYLRTVVKVRINPELNRENQEIAAAFGVGGYPAFFIIVPNSRPAQVSPFLRGGRTLSPAEFADRCREVARPRLERLVDPVEAAEAAPPKLITNAPAPAVDAILTRYARLTGAPTAQARAASRVVKGRVDIPGVSFGGRFEFYTTASGKSLTVVSLEPLGVVKQGFDGRAGWTSSEKTSAAGKLPELAVVAAGDLFRDAKLSEIYTRTKLLGTAKEGDRSVYLVEAAPRSGPAETLYFDAESGLLVHRDFTRPGLRGQVRVELYLSDWRRADGYLLPRSMTQTIGDFTLVYTVEEIKHNVAVDEAIFQRPANAVAVR